MAFQRDDLDWHNPRVSWREVGAAALLAGAFAVLLLV